MQWLNAAGTFTRPANKIVIGGWTNSCALDSLRDMDGTLSTRFSFRARLIASFTAIYLIWGSTYLCIKIAVETMPPMLMGGVRFLVAGIILYAWKKHSRRERETFQHWRSAAIGGFLFFLMGNGAVIIGVQFVPSGIVALLVSIMPVWMVLFDQFSPSREVPGIPVIIGLLLGIVGLIILFNPFEIVSQNELHVGGALIVLLGSFCWAAASIYTRGTSLPRSHGLTAGMQMISGGIMLFIAGIATGELNNINFSAFSLASVLALLYLIFFGSIVAFTAYNWLLTATTPSKIGTYSYVNPVVALLLGAAIGGEVLTVRSIVASGVILLGVILITTFRRRKATAKEIDRIEVCPTK